MTRGALRNANSSGVTYASGSGFSCAPSPGVTYATSPGTSHAADLATRRPITNMTDAASLIAALNLKPLPIEGGYYAESYRASLNLYANVLPGSYRGTRSAATAIYYLLTPDTYSAIHRLPGDEIFHFYLGDPVEMLLLHPDRGSSAITLGQDIPGGMKVQKVVTGGTWQGSRLRPGGRFALLGTTMSPGFDFEDFEAGVADDLCARYPANADQILQLTR